MPDLSSIVSIIINEIAWMGTNTSAHDEWIELYNNTALDIDLSGWKLIAKDGTPKIILNDQILAKGFFILERTSDESAPNVSANQIYTGALSNKGEYLQLIDTHGNVVDELNCVESWFAGNNKTKQTMEKIGDNW